MRIISWCILCACCTFLYHFILVAMLIDTFKTRDFYHPTPCSSVGVTSLPVPNLGGNGCKNFLIFCCSLKLETDQNQPNLERSMEKWEWMTLNFCGKVRINHLTPKIFARLCTFLNVHSFHLRLCCRTTAHQLVERSQWLPEGCSACLAPTPHRSYVTLDVIESHRCNTIPIIFLDHFKKKTNHTAIVMIYNIVHSILKIEIHNS